MPDLPYPSSFGRFEVRGLMGRTERSSLFRAWDPLLAREVALRIFGIPSGLTGVEQARAREKLSSELQSLGGLRNPALVEILENGATRDFLFLEMELLEGASLDGFTVPGFLLPPRAVVQIGLLTAQVLADLHEAGLMYAGLRPSQIFLLSDGTLRLQDPPRSLHLPGALMAHTPPAEVCAFLSPEQLTGSRPGPAADLYALGAVLYALLAGEPHFHGDSAASVIFRVLNEPPRPLSETRPDLPAVLSALVMAALNRNPALRPQSAAGMAGDLEKILHEMGGPFERLPVLAPAPRQTPKPETSDTGPESPSPRPRRSRRRWPVIVGGAGILVLLWILPGLVGWDPFGSFRRPLEDGIQAVTGPVGRFIRMTRPDQTLEVITDPPGLSVQVEGGRWRLDDRGRVVAAGNETIPGIVRVEDRCREGEIQIDPIDLPERIHLPTRIRKVLFEVGSEPSGAELILDGKPVSGRTPLSLELDLCRDHELEIHARGFNPASVRLSGQDERETWRTTLQRISLGPPAVGRIAVPAAPGYSVLVFDETGRSRLGQSGGELALPPGRYRLTLAAPEVLFRKTAAVEVKAGATVRLAEKFPVLGKLTVHAVPPGGTVTVKMASGPTAEIGVTPVNGFSLVPGDYQVIIKHPLSGTSVTRQVALRAGARETIRVGKEEWR